MNSVDIFLVLHKVVNNNIIVITATRVYAAVSMTHSDVHDFVSPEIQVSIIILELS